MPIPEGRSSPSFSHPLVTKRRKGRPDKARDPQASTPEGPAGVLVEYAEEAERAQHRRVMVPMQ